MARFSRGSRSAETNAGPGSAVQPPQAERRWPETGRHRGGLARNRRRAVSGQAIRGREGGRRGGHRRRRPGRARLRHQAPARRPNGLDRGADGPAGQRPLAGRVRGHRAGTVPVHDRGLGRPLRDLEPPVRQTRRGRTGRGPGAGGGGAPRRGTAARATGPDSEKLMAYTAQLRKGKAAATAALESDLAVLMERHADRSLSVTYGRQVEVTVEPQRARYGAWYEMFPRSAGKQGRHGTFRDVEEWLPYISGMGFDVLYFPPIHPIGRTNRKGANNSAHAKPDEPGSPWAIGSEEGGHKAIHPQLGTLDDFKHLMSAAGTAGLTIALDLAFQCSPDHPYTREHPEWFRHRPDGSIQYAENPPKKYE